MSSPDRAFHEFRMMLEDQTKRVQYIIEHREGGTDNIVGSFVYEGGSFDMVCLGWQHHGMNRTTGFTRGSWKCDIQGEIAFLIRTAPDADYTDIPWRSADLYTIVFGKR